jgi:hypothetical protein
MNHHRGRRKIGHPLVRTPDVSGDKPKVLRSRNTEGREAITMMIVDRNHLTPVRGEGAEPQGDMTP